MKEIIFTSDRLQFRSWKNEDLHALVSLNSNPLVMEYFPRTLDEKDCEKFLHRMQKQMQQNEFCYFAVEVIQTQEFIGFIGLSKQTYPIDFNPSVDIGWRLHPKFWGKGYATEGAKACLQYGFNQIGLKRILAVAPITNTNSIAVMQKIEMQKVKEFTHPLLLEYPTLKKCVVYEKSIG